MYSVYSEMFGAELKSVAFDEGLHLNTEELLEAAAKGARLVLIANPNQPTGTLLEPAFIAELAERSGSTGTVVAVDEAYFPFSQTTVVPLVRAHPNLVVLRSFSKAAGMAGLRLGYVCANPRIVESLFKVRSVHDVNAFAIRCAIELLDCPAVVDDYVAEVAAGAEVLRGRAEEMGIRMSPTAANFALLDVASLCDPRLVVEGLRERGYLVRGPFSFPGLASFVRVTLGPPALMERFTDALADTLDRST
jgi:histidinol-phosphate aminotransferase